MKKTYVLDTSVIIHDPQCLEKLTNCNIILQIYVLNELDKLKKQANDTGRNARTFIRILDEIRGSGKICKGIKLPQYSSSIKADIANDDTSAFGDPEYGDSKILACAKRLQANTKSIVLLTRDINLRIRSEAFGIKSEDYKKDEKNSKNISSLYSGIITIKNAELSSLLCEKKLLPCAEHEAFKSVLPNECIYITDENGSGATLGRRTGDFITVVRDNNLWNLKTKNKEQTFAADLLCDPNVPLVSLIGRAGTGKTLLAIAAGLEALINQKQYKKLIIYRPMIAVGSELGFLPGNMEEKMEPWMDAVKDSLEFLTNSNDSAKSKKKKSNQQNDDYKQDWRDKLGQFADNIYLEPTTYIRGRSIPNAYIILDESQNLSPHEIKTILTRAGPGTKLVLTGDIEQIDHDNLDAMNNGLTYVSSAFRNSHLAGHITLLKGERSKLATEASKIL